MMVRFGYVCRWYLKRLIMNIMSTFIRTPFYTAIRFRAAMTPYFFFNLSTESRITASRFGGVRPRAISLKVASGR